MFHIQPAHVLRGLLLISLVFTLITVGIVLTRHNAETGSSDIPPRLERVMQLLDTGLEANVPTWFATAQFFLCALLLTAIAAAKSRDDFRAHWWAMALIFFLLSADEAAALHEGLTNVVRDLLNTSGFLEFAWVIPYGIFTLLFVLAYIPLLRALPGRSRRLFLLSGAIYVGGALGMEMVGAYYSGLDNANNLVFAAMWITEEFMEMAGLSLFAYSLLVYLRDHVRPVTFVLTHPDAAADRSNPEVE